MPRLLAIVACSAGLLACAAESGPGFHLPQGDAERGREAFVTLRCHACHSIEGIEPPLSVPASGGVILGGDTVRVRTYGDLVTSIVNPSHRLARGARAEDVTPDGRSLMSGAFLNDVVTVQQLVDLVALLQSAYEVVPPPIRPYWETYPSGGEVPIGDLPPR